MKTALDDGVAWELRSLNFEGRAVELTLLELIAGPPTTIDVAGAQLGGARPLTVSPSSRAARVTFAKPVAFRVADESLGDLDRQVRRESAGWIRVAVQSPFLESLNAAGFLDVVARTGPYRHYCVITEDQIIDVASVDPPEVVIL